MRSLLTSLCAALAIAIVVPSTRASEPTLESLKATRNRPLFSPTRRPPPARISPITPASPGPRPPPQVDLTGVILGPGERAAIVVVPGGSAPRAVHLGAAIDGWRVTAIAARSIVLSHAGRSVEIRLPARASETNQRR